ncbi:U32 family peptidase [Ruminiclostridium herbifermentans]|uniref:U32 family peptidase n=1 Tax=Ruminiclostridium herbifermentans TaxID=2488810 RepID=A0A4V6EP56_9FIRM|nr:U32 family peptidase [Ruminiclostridium herbifermentans]QNU67195.1 U32 family peptidase [Ruminiclostridium herbifermentans]
MNLNRKVELLAPAGSYEAFLAAVENGCDAVYLGGKLLNARQFAGNFDDEELQKAVDYAHTRGVRVYLTLNTLVLDDEMQEAIMYAAKAYEMGVDAFIIQDIGLASSLKKAIPEITIHASTQMTTYSSEGVSELEKMGFSRVVLARELTLSEIKEICITTQTEIEVFVHGALCISYSGQCLMSSIIGGRSGNRGKCAQPCRLPYSIQKDNNNIRSGYLLSSKDICFIENLSDLIDAGVSSIKIEGRMKSPEYVASVVSTYRKYLDIIEQQHMKKGKNEYTVSKEDMQRLMQSFNRGGFSKGYLQGKMGPAMMAFEKPKNWGTYLGTVLEQDRGTNSVKIRLDNSLGNGDGIEIWSKKLFEDSPGGIITKIVKDGKLVKRAYAGDVVWVSVIKGKVEKGSRVYKTSDKELLEQAALSYAKGMRKVDISAEFTLKLGQLPVLCLKDDRGNSVSASGDILPEEAVNKPLTRERISEQLGKMGSTPFNIVNLTLDIDNNVVIPISELNNIRRKAADLLENERILSGRKLKTEHGELLKSIEYVTKNIPISSEKKHTINENAKISVMLYSEFDNLDFDKINADRLYLPLVSLLKDNVKIAASKCREEGKEIFAYIPAIIKGKYSQIINKNLQAISQDVDGFLVGNMGIAKIVRDKLGENVKLIGDYSLNVLNSWSMHFLKETGYSGATLSYELNLSQLNSMNFPQEFEAEVGIYGKIPVMTSEYCPVGGSVSQKTPQNCKNVCKNGVYQLKDRKGAAFLVKCDCVDCRSTIFNSNVIFVPEHIGQISKAGVKYMRLNFVDESVQEIYDIVNLHRSINNNCNYSEKDKIAEKIRAKGYTKGHFQRGV